MKTFFEEIFEKPGEESQKKPACKHLDFSLTEIAQGGEFVDFVNGQPDDTDSDGFVIHWTTDIAPTGRFTIQCHKCKRTFQYNAKSIKRANKVFQAAWASFTKRNLPSSALTIDKEEAS